MNPPPDRRETDTYRRACHGEAARIIDARRGEPLVIDGLLDEDKRRLTDPIDELIADLRRIEAERGGTIAP